ncbi:hypothetical protein TVAG_316810 [Trichomonas vaginalis G3]|uniref:Uncharacterized protein n=1 Tax=Trichomonas vaginalis (strain ATCC PRA-98 / G3) TaxID=412133 RepID=A2F059_TRIV3|nr:Ankyrin repeat family [Trichomonas vaginalis G3]EAY01694.1 hypothetical protein TVAG_316810 [Trichomonas vaginalis G3]KAI5489629.1 Ankyrin repeat family [Trichomonas vaginalis G3]|eukprot:XP_001330390.1 hypothetical protein [Trichomonas vaginalis G3]
MFNIPSICEYFLSNGAYFNEKDNYGQTALHYALECNRKEISEVLISHGANIKDKDIDGKTAILIAAEYYSLETLEFPKIE